jgi:hypothetical protein
MIHFRAAAEFSHDPKRDAKDLLIAHFEKFYPDQVEARYKCDRMVQALAFWDYNFRDFDFEKVSVVGDKAALVSGAMGYALHAYFASMPDHQLGRVYPPVKDVRDMAQSTALKYAEE